MKINTILGTHEEEDDRVDGRVCHGEPEGREKEVLGVGLGEDGGVVVGVDEVGVVGQPAHSEHDQHHHEHDAHLREETSGERNEIFYNANNPIIYQSQSK